MSDIKYLETHEWYLINEQVITVGISDFAPVSYTHLTLPTTLLV